MIMIIGGSYQGKLQFAIQKFSVPEEKIYQGIFPAEENQEPVIINGLNTLVRKLMEQETDPEEEILKQMKGFPNAIVITDEIGSGIVPMDRLEIRFREQVGRIQVRLAENASEVYRIVCGLPQKLK